MTETAVGNVYCVKMYHPCVVKIGFTTNVHRRFKQLQTGSHQALTLFAVIRDVPRSVERMLHKRYADRRLMGEWFRDDDSFISRELSRTAYILAGGEA